MPLYNFPSDKTKFKSYSNDKKNVKEKSKDNTDNMNKMENDPHKQTHSINIDKKSEDFISFANKCEKLKGRTYKFIK